MKRLIIVILIILSSFKTHSQTSFYKLENKSDFDKFSGLPLSDKYGQVSSIKVVYVIHEDELYFINSKYFKYHHEFCNELRHEELDLENFNRLNYSDNPKRDYLLANINFYKALDKYALEISPVDLMPLQQILELYKKVCDASFIGSNLCILLNSSRLQDSKEQIDKEIRVINPSDIYHNLSYQAIAKYSNDGTLKFIRDIESEKVNIDPKDIIVINKTPVYLPTVAGIIVTEFQTPLSHLTILGQNRKIPICAYKSAFGDSSLLKYKNQKVRLTVKSDTLCIEISKDDNTIASKNKAINLKSDLSVDTIIDVKYLDNKSFEYVGNKASNFGTLFKISRKANFKVPESAFAIPFYFYNQHIEKSRAKELINYILNNPFIISIKDSLEYYLKQVRYEIENSPVDSSLLVDVRNKIISSGDYTSMRFRSSTNAEDTKGFSGAGLYKSQTGILNNSKKPIDKAIKQVWASLWTYEAFAEREYYNIKHENVYMGILVHRTFPSEGVNGVAITKDLYRSDSYGFVINAQLGDEKVVKPKSGNICDQFICYPDNSDNIYKNKNTVDIITFSNLNSGKLIMSDIEIQNLANQLDIIKKYFINHSFTSRSYTDFGLDIEFKLDGTNRDLYIKQVRLYND
jgi:pyruvate, water dikinase